MNRFKKTPVSIKGWNSAFGIRVVSIHVITVRVVKILSSIYPVYNHNWRNISTVYIYIYIYIYIYK